MRMAKKLQWMLRCLATCYAPHYSLACAGERRKRGDAHSAGADLRAGVVGGCNGVCSLPAWIYFLARLSVKLDLLLYISCAMFLGFAPPSSWPLHTRGTALAGRFCATAVCCCLYLDRLARRTGRKKKKKRRLRRLGTRKGVIAPRRAALGGIKARRNDRAVDASGARLG